MNALNAFPHQALVPSWNPSTNLQTAAGVITFSENLFCQIKFNAKGYLDKLSQPQATKKPEAQIRPYVLSRFML